MTDGKEGFYSIQYQGISGVGLGLLAFDTNIVTGVDIAGVLYDGEYQHNQRNDMLDVRLTLTVPPGVHLVMGIPPQSQEATLTIEMSLPRDLGNETPVTVPTTDGQVTVLFRKIRDFPS